MNKEIIYKIENQTAVITLNRPENMNAFSRVMTELLYEAIMDIHSQANTLKGLIIIGAGEKSFCAGADLKERKSMTTSDVKKFLTKIQHLFALIENLEIPVVSCINGYALGGGLEMALCTDFRLAVKTAALGLTETTLGIIPGAGDAKTSRLIGLSAAKRLIYSGKRISADESLQLGLVDGIAESHAELLEKGFSLLQEFENAAPIALAQAKFAMQNGMNVDLQTALEIEKKAYQITLFTEDRVEALNAFKEKRKPQFKGK